MTNKEMFNSTFDICSYEIFKFTKEQFDEWCNKIYRPKTDSVEVIRCENCAHSHRSYDLTEDNGHKYYCNLRLEWMRDYDFCSNAIRRENAIIGILGDVV